MLSGEDVVRVTVEVCVGLALVDAVVEEDVPLAPVLVAVVGVTSAEVAAGVVEDADVGGAGGAAASSVEEGVVATDGAVVVVVEGTPASSVEVVAVDAGVDVEDTEVEGTTPASSVEVVDVAADELEPDVDTEVLVVVAVSVVVVGVGGTAGSTTGAQQLCTQSAVSLQTLLSGCGCLGKKPLGQLKAAHVCRHV